MAQTAPLILLTFRYLNSQTIAYCSNMAIRALHISELHKNTHLLIRPSLKHSSFRNEIIQKFVNILLTRHWWCYDIFSSNIRDHDIILWECTGTRVQKTKKEILLTTWGSFFVAGQTLKHKNKADINIHSGASLPCGLTPNSTLSMHCTIQGKSYCIIPQI
jgi:hypothetical protein